MTSQKFKQYSIGLYQGDVETLDWLVEQLGLPSRAEAVRAAVRVYAYHVESLTGKRK